MLHFNSCVVFWILKSNPLFWGEEFIKNQSLSGEDVLIDIYSVSSTILWISGSLPLKLPVKKFFENFFSLDVWAEVDRKFIDWATQLLNVIIPRFRVLVITMTVVTLTMVFTVSPEQQFVRHQPSNLTG